MARRTNDDGAPDAIRAQIIADRDGKPSFAVVPFEVFVALTAYARHGVEASRSGAPRNFRRKKDLDRYSMETLKAVSEWLLSDRYFAVSEAGDGGEMDEDVAAYDTAKASDEERFPARVADRLIAGESPLKVFREYRGLTQGRLAKTAKTTAPYLSQIENGRRTGSVGLLRRLADALRVEIDDLV